MPPFVKPLTALTAEQMASVLARIVKRRAGATNKLTQEIKTPFPRARSLHPGFAAEALDQPTGFNTAPTREYGQLNDIQNPRGEPRIVTQPIEQAMQTFMGNPERYKPIPPGPQARRVSPNPEGYRRGYGPEGIEGGTPVPRGADPIAREIMKFREVRPSGVARGANIIQQEMNTARAPEPSPADLYKSLVEKKEAKKMASKASSPEELKSVLHLSTTLEDLWGHMGGGRSSAAQDWKNLWKNSSHRDKIANAKDYFISAAIQNKTKPEWFQKYRAREYNLLHNMYDAYKDATGIDLGGI